MSYLTRNNPRSVEIAKQILKEHFIAGQRTFDIHDLKKSTYFRQAWQISMPSVAEDNLFENLVNEVGSEFNLQVDYARQLSPRFLVLKDINKS